MQVLKSNFFRPRKCAFGDFELQPEPGWKISQAFVDFESKLLVVSVSITDESQWIDNGYNGRIISTREYKVDLNTLKILEPDDWKIFFNYEKIETLSEDGNYKLVTQRIFEPERNSDGITEELYDLRTHAKIGSSSSVAFREDKRETLLEQLYRSIREQQERKAKLDAQLTLEQYHVRELTKLGSANPILCYGNESQTFQLQYDEGQFTLEQSGKMPVVYSDWHLLRFEPIATFESLDAFWQFFTENPNWYKNHRIHESQTKLPGVLAKYVISCFNEIRREQAFTKSDYHSIHSRERVFGNADFKPTEQKQWCFNCKQEVSYYPRYPMYICSDCASKDKFAPSGERVEFYNLGFSGGLNIVYKDPHGNTIREDGTQTCCDCWIDGKLFYAQEARFGGIVIQRRDQ